MTALKKGFTLIELLIVIAILGVLAVVVLVAINPVQQLARTRDAGRISSVTQIGHAFESYMASHNGSYPAALTDLSTTGDLSAIPAEVTNTLSSVCTGGTEENGWCYAVAADAFAVWSALESDSNIEIAGGGDAYAIYSSETGKTCISATEGTTPSTFTIANCLN